MSLTVAYAGIFLGIVVWLLAVSRLRTRPWEAQGGADGRELPGAGRAATARTGMWVFLAVITSFFGLTITAYWMRMGHGLAHGLTHDWHALTEPGVLWVNSGLLVLGSIAMQWARAALSRGETERARFAWILGGAFALAFLAGQYLGWRQLLAAGYYAASNPANAFFYVLTGLHALHLFGGLAVWAATLARMQGSAFRAAVAGSARATAGAPGDPDSGDDPELDTMRVRVELCTVYWHYLLLVWLVLFGLLLLT